MIKKINRIIVVFTLFLNTLFLVLTLIGKYNSNILVCSSLYIIVFIPMIMRKYFSINLDEIIDLIFLIFIFIAQLLGSVMHFYDLIYWFDSFVHFISGLLTSLLALIMLIEFNKYDKKSLGFNVVFILSITLAVASLWEIFEYTADSLLGSNAQKVIETGVGDTMKDVICALLGNILVIASYVYEIACQKKLAVCQFLSKIKK